MVVLTGGFYLLFGLMQSLCTKHPMEYIQNCVMFADCANNEWGRGCSESCQCLDGDKCDVFSGSCPNGCAKYIVGTSCNISKFVNTGAKLIFYIHVSIPFAKLIWP